MALAALATAADLTARNITVPAGLDANTLIASASDAVRDAAGCAITRATSTVDLVSFDRCELDLPAGPVTSVASVSIEGNTIAQSVLTNGVYSDGWRLVGDQLLFSRVWFVAPATVTVTYTHGLATVPADIVDLVCGMVSIAANAGADGDYGANGLLKSTRLGDFSETYQRPAGADSPSPIALPDSVRERLRARFGTNVAVVRFR